MTSACLCQISLTLRAACVCVCVCVCDREKVFGAAHGMSPASGAEKTILDSCWSERPTCERVQFATSLFREVTLSRSHVARRQFSYLCTYIVLAAHVLATMTLVCIVPTPSANKFDEDDKGDDNNVAIGLAGSY